MGRTWGRGDQRGRPAHPGQRTGSARLPKRGFSGSLRRIPDPLSSRHSSQLQRRLLSDPGKRFRQAVWTESRTRRNPRSPTACVVCPRATRLFQPVLPRGSGASLRCEFLLVARNPDGGGHPYDKHSGHPCDEQRTVQARGAIGDCHRPQREHDLADDACSRLHDRMRIQSEGRNRRSHLDSLRHRLEQLDICQEQRDFRTPRPEGGADHGTWRPGLLLQCADGPSQRNDGRPCEGIPAAVNYGIRDTRSNRLHRALRIGPVRGWAITWSGTELSHHVRCSGNDTLSDVTLRYRAGCMSASRGTANYRDIPRGASWRKGRLILMVAPGRLLAVQAVEYTGSAMLTFSR